MRRLTTSPIAPIAVGLLALVAGPASAARDHEVTGQAVLNWHSVRNTVGIGDLVPEDSTSAGDVAFVLKLLEETPVVTAYDATTGDTLWQRDLPALSAVTFTSGLVAASLDGSRLYVNVGSRFTFPFYRLYALDASNGESLWQSGAVTGPWDTLLPAEIGVAPDGRGGERVFVAGTDGSLVAPFVRTDAFDGATGERLWTATDATVPSLDALDVHPGGRAVFLLGHATGGTGSSVRALDAATGAPIWSVEGDTTHTFFDVSPDGGSLVLSGSQNAAGETLRALDTSDGTTLWTHAPVVGGTFPRTYQVEHAPDGSRVFYSFSYIAPGGSGVTGLGAVDASDGSADWQVDTPTAGLLVSGDGGLVLSGYPVPGPGSTPLDVALQALDAATGGQVWFTDDPAIPFGFDEFFLVAGADRIVVAADAPGLATEIAAFDVADGAHAWSRVETGLVSGADGAHDVVAGPGGDTVFVAGTFGLHGIEAQTVAYDARSGEERWSTYSTIPKPAARLQMLTDRAGEHLFVRVPGEDAPDGAVFALAAEDGQELWSSPGGGVFALSPGGDRLYRTGGIDTPILDLFNQTTQDYLTEALDAKTGDVLWSRSFDDEQLDDTATAIAVAPDGERVFVGGYSTIGPQILFAPPLGFEALTLAYDRDGSLLWTERVNPFPEGNAIDTPTHMATDATGETLFTAGNRRSGLDVVLRIFVTAQSAATGAFDWTLVVDPAGVNAGAEELRAFAVDGDRLYLGGLASDLPSMPDDLFVLALDAATGSELWSRRIGGAGQDELLDLVVASNGSLIVTGSFEPDTPSGRDAVTLVLDPDTGGELGRVTFAGRGPSNEQGVALAAHPERPIVFSAGNLTSTGPVDFFLDSIGLGGRRR